MTTGQLTTAACRLATPAITDVMSRARLDDAVGVDAAVEEAGSLR